MIKWVVSNKPVFIVLTYLLICSSFVSIININNPPIKFPYKECGLTEKQAAEHLLNRFSYGAKPGEIDSVIKTGLENWFMCQLEGNLPDDSLNKMLVSFNSLKMNNQQIAENFPEYGQIVDRALKEGLITKDSADILRNKLPWERIKMGDIYLHKKGLKNMDEVLRQLNNQKIFRAAYTRNQLREVLTDFWFNHFNVSLSTNYDVKHYITVYEKDVIRPNVLNKFYTLLLSTAKSPAMLSYLDNYNSFSSPLNDNETGSNQLRLLYKQQSAMEQTGDTGKPYKEISNTLRLALSSRPGFNENYARELMELHTLGVDGGYTQTDVTNVTKS